MLVLVMEEVTKNYQNGAVSNKLTDGGGGREVRRGDSESVDVKRMVHPTIPLHKFATP